MGTPIHCTTASRALKKAGWVAVTKKKKPLLKRAHIRACYQFAECHLHWTVEDWKKEEGHLLR
jgi:hypothetical protein